MASDDEKSFHEVSENNREDSPENDRSERSRSRSKSPKRSKKMKDGDKERKKEEKDEKRRRSRSGDREKRRKTKRSRSRSRSADPRNPKPSRCLGVFGLSVYTTEDEIYHIFSKYGSVEKVQIVTDAKTRRSRGFCFVYFNSKDDAKLAREECSGMKVNGRVIRVEYSVRERAHTPTPGIYMGKPTYNNYDRGFDRRRGGDYYGGGGRSRYRRSPSPYYRRSRRYRSRSRSY